MPFREITPNGLNMVRLAFQYSGFSVRRYVYFMRLISVLELSAKCTVFLLCLYV